jgi:hypothetical protein
VWSIRVQYVLQVGEHLPDLDLPLPPTTDGAVLLLLRKKRVAAGAWMSRCARVDGGGVHTRAGSRKRLVAGRRFIMGVLLVLVTRCNCSLA